MGGDEEGYLRNHRIRTDLLRNDAQKSEELGSQLLVVDLRQRSENYRLAGTRTRVAGGDDGPRDREGRLENVHVGRLEILRKEHGVLHHCLLDPREGGGIVLNVLFESTQRLDSILPLLVRADDLVDRSEIGVNPLQLTVTTKEKMDFSNTRIL